MAKKKLSEVVGRFSGGARRAARKAKKAAKETTEQAAEGLKSFTDQVAGTKAPEQEEFEAPRITTDTVAEHREKVLSEARRFIYPLQTRRRIVAISISIVFGVIVLSILLAGILLYRFDSSNAFVYNVSKFIPFPVAKVDGEFVPFERYLFEVRHTIFYLKNFSQEGVEVDSEEGKELVLETKRRILEKVQRDELAYQLAEANGIKVESKDVDSAIKDLTITGGIDQSEGTLESVLAKYYGWDLSDLRRTVKSQLIYQRLLPVLDEAASKKLESVEKKLEKSNFASVARAESDDKESAEQNGRIGNIGRNDASLFSAAREAIFKTKEGKRTEAVVGPTGYHIFRVDDVIDDDTRRVSQIFIRFFSIENYLAEELEKLPHSTYLSLD